MVKPTDAEQRNVTALVGSNPLECAERHSKVLPGAFVRLIEFNTSSIDFELLFWSEEYRMIEDVRSDLRLMIDSGFRKYCSVSPFPQRDLHIKNFPVPSEFKQEPNNGIGNKA